MKKVLFAALFGFSLFAFTACRKNTTMPVTMANSPTAERSAVYYDFIVGVTNTCNAVTLTVNNCGTGSYTPWQSTGTCTNGNNFNGTVAGSGNPLLLSNPATFPNIGATYHIFANTFAVKDVLQITFRSGYNATHKPTINYNSATRKFTVVNAGNPAYVTVNVFSYSGFIGVGFAEFC